MTDPIDTARQEGIALGLAMAAQRADQWHRTTSRLADEAEEHGYESRCEELSAVAGNMAGLRKELRETAPTPPHVAAARVLLDCPEVAAALLAWCGAHQYRLRQIQGFAYGDDGLLFTVRDCWLTGEQVVWQRQSTPETRGTDHAEMMRQIDLRRVSLALTAALEQIAKEGA